MFRPQPCLSSLNTPDMPSTAMVCIDGGISFLFLVILLFPVLSLALYVVIHLQQCVGDRWLAVETVTSKHLSPLSKTSYGPFYLFVLHLLFSFFSSFGTASAISSTVISGLEVMPNW